MLKIENLTNKPLLKNNDKITIKVLIDKITIVREPVDAEYADEIRSVLYSTCLNDEQFTKVKKWSPHYQATFQAINPDAPDQTFFIQFDPKSPMYGPVRIEYNPSKDDGQAIEYLRAWCYCLFDQDYDELLLFGKVTRLDAAIDFHGIDLEALQVLHKTAVSSSWYSRKGQKQTLYYGRKNSPHMIRVYDKAKESELVGKTAITRVERVLRPKCLLKDISQINNPFSPLSFCMWPDACPEGIDEYEWAGFKALAKEGTLPSALAIFPAHKRKRLRTAFKKAQIQTFTSDEAYHMYQDYVGNSGLLLPVNIKTV